MRKRFEPQLILGAIPIAEVEIDTKSRDELPPVLMGLQHIFNTPGLNEEVFEILERKITLGKQETGRPGMGLWEVLVLATVRMCLGTNYDRLRDMANNHKSIRGILGVEQPFVTGKQYPLSTLKGNVGLLDEATLIEINELVVKAGHKLLKKKRKRSV